MMGPVAWAIGISSHVPCSVRSPISFSIAASHSSCVPIKDKPVAQGSQDEGNRGIAETGLDASTESKKGSLEHRDPTGLDRRVPSTGFLDTQVGTGRGSCLLTITLAMLRSGVRDSPMASALLTLGTSEMLLSTSIILGVGFSSLGRDHLPIGGLLLVPLAMPRRLVLTRSLSNTAA